MLKKKCVRSITAGLLALVMIFTTALSGAGNILTVQAESVYETQNLLVNPDFEENTAFSPANSTSHYGNWFYWQNAAKTTENAQTGTASVKFTGGDSALEQDLNGASLIQGMTYVYSVWARLSSTTSEEHIVGVKNYGGTEIKQQVNSTEWKKYEIEFVYTSGNPRVYGYVGTHGGVDMYIDNASVKVKSDVDRVEIENGIMTVDFSDAREGMPLISEVSATYSVTPGNISGTVQWLDAEWEPTEKIATLYFPEIQAIAVDQTVVVNLTYGGATITLDYVVEANGDEVVTADIETITAENGKITAVLDVVPTIVPEEDEFTWEYKINDGEYKELAVEDFGYDQTNNQVTVSFDAIRTAEACTVSVKVSYREKSLEDAFELEASDANTYYVDSENGDDSNNGLSADKAFASIDKLNTLTFLPGDEILFKKGDTFTGCFKPQGSGTETAPISIGSYGEGDERPVLQPGADWTVDYVMSASAMVTDVKVNYVLQFYNVEYWEVNDLEIFDPNSEAYLTPGSGKYIGNSANDVYRSGITIQAEDIGTLEHFYIDNVVIHGFHGPGTNIGKTSGGITMNVITNEARNRSQSVPTQINDIRVSNCEIYDVGRSGINFLTPWSYRTEEKWGPFNYGTSGYDYLPYEDFYMANNYIHDIDGDGTIIDNCSGAVAEYNLVTRCCLRPQTEGGGAAVGLFNWNSDDTIFQFNEVYDIRLGSGSTASNDGQGIEIDALNDRTWVQYNYLHDNMGGFMMLCNVSDNYRSFDGIVRYNISQNDYTHPRQGLFDIYSANYGTEIYNNTFYLTDRAVSQSGYGNYADAGELFLFSAVGAYDTMKFYNNIFYYDGETPVTANQFGDSVIDWQSNIFYGFSNLPANDNENAPNISADPKLVNAGAGGTGTKPGTMPDLSCYHLEADSPALNAGVLLDDHGQRDFYGNEIAGIPDIGAYESGSVLLKLISNHNEIVIDQEENTITIADNAKISVNDLFAGINYETGVTVSVNRENRELTGGIRLAEGDVVTASYDGQTISYVVKVTEGAEESNVIPPERTNATAGSEETGDSNDAAVNALDGNVGTIWHTEWDGAAAEDRYLTLEIKDGYEYEIFGYEYTPRTGSSSGAVNGIITSYEIYVSDDNATWTKVANGNWAQDSAIKTVTFTPVKAKYVKLLAVASVGNFASAAEARLLGHIYDVQAPTVPVVTCEDISQTSVVLSWTESADNLEVSDYILMNGDTEIAVFDADTTSYEVTGLEPGTEYTFTVQAVDAAGNVSDKGSVIVKTESKISMEIVTDIFEDVEEGKWYVDAIQYVYDHGIMSGNKGLFNPTGNITRAQVVTTLYNMEGRPAVSDKSAVSELADVKDGQWYTDAVCWAYNTDVANGNSSTKMFNMSTPVTRQQLATFFYKYADYKGLDITSRGDYSDLEGADEVAGYAEDAMKWAYGEGLITGSKTTENGVTVYKLNPKGTATRAQMASILQRFCVNNGL